VSADRAEPTSAAAQEILDIARGDPGRARLLTESLRHLAEQDARPELRELAQQVLAGRSTLRQTMMSGVYREALGQRMDVFLQWYRGLTPQERARQEAAGREQLERLRAAEEDNERGHDRGRSRPERI